MRAWRWHRSARDQYVERHSRYRARARPSIIGALTDYIRATETRRHRGAFFRELKSSVRRCFLSLYVAALIVASVGTSIGAQSDPKSQSDRVAARIRALQAESDRLAAQARTV